MSQNETIAVLSPGEMGSAVGSALRDHGARVLTSLAGRSQQTARRAREAGMEPQDSLDEIVRQSKLVISIVPSLSAKPLAASVADAMRRTGAQPQYLDANSIAPHTAKEIASMIEGAGGSFVDGCIIGSAPELRKNAMLYLSGAGADLAAGTIGAAMRSAVIGPLPGQASGFKVLYAGLTKGLSALGMELLAGAELLGLSDQLLDKYQATHPSVVRFFHHTLPGLPARAGRRAEEMIELADTLRSLGLSANMALAAKQTLEQIDLHHRANSGPDGLGLNPVIRWWTSEQAH